MPRRSEEEDGRCKKRAFDEVFLIDRSSNRGRFVRTIHTLTLKLNALPFCNSGGKSALLDINVSRAIRTKRHLQERHPA